MPRLEFTIAVKPFGAQAQKDAGKLTGELRAQDKEVGKLGKSTLAFSKEFKKHTEIARKSTHEVTGAVEAMAHRIHSINEKIGESFRKTFDKVKDHIKESLKVSTGMFLHDAIEKLVDLPKRLLDAGKGNIEARERLMREFGKGDASFYDATSKRVGRKAGFDDSAALTALFPVAEAVDGVQAGTSYHGKKLNEQQAAKLRQALFGKGADLFQRITTVMRTSPEEASQVGYLLANAGTGPEGMRGLVAALHLNRAFSAKVLKANEKGGVADVITPDLAKQLGIKRGQKVGQGDIIDILLRKSGITEEAATDERKKFGFQIKSIGATFESSLGDVGERVLDKITGGFAKGKTLAEKFQEALESPKGKETIDKIADGLVRAAEGAIKLASEVPKVIGFLESHKTALAFLGAGYGGLSILGGIGGKIPGANKVLDKVGIGDGVRVHVTNWPMGGFGGGGSGSPVGGGGGKMQKVGAVLGALTAGYAVGTALDDLFDISGNLTGTANGDIKNADDAAFAQDEKRRKNRRILRSMSSQVPADLRARYESLTADATGVGTPIEKQRSAMEQINQMLAQFHMQPPNVNVYVGGKQVVAVVEHEQTKRIKNESANGAAR